MGESARVLAFDVGRHFIRHTVFEGSAEPGRIGSIVTSVDSAESFYRAVAEVANAQAAETPLDGVPFSFPGFVDTRRRRAVTAGPLPSLYKRPLAEEFAERLDAEVPVWIENDANCAALAERFSGNARNLDDFVLMTIDTGVGGAIFLDGHIQRGRDWRAGEFGMMVVNYENGAFRNLHDYASMTALAQMYADETGSSPAAVVPGALLRHLDDPQIRAVAERWADWVALGIFNIVSAVDPQCLLLGGAISREVTLLPLVREALERNPNWKDFRTPIKRCRHSGNAGLIGAYCAFMEEVARA